MTPDPVQLPQLRTPGQNDLLPPASYTTLVLTVSWRLVLTLISGTGLVLMFGPLRSLPEVINQALYFTTISNILVFLVALAGVLRPLLLRDRPVRQRLEGNQGWLRGLTACAALLTGLVFGFIMAGDLSEPVSFIPHLVLPVLAVADWVLVGRNQSRLAWWVPLTWTLTLAPYLFVYAWDAQRNHPRYAFLDPALPSWWSWIGMLSAGFLVLAYLLWGLGRLRGLRGAGRARSVWDLLETTARDRALDVGHVVDLGARERTGKSPGGCGLRGSHTRHAGQAPLLPGMSSCTPASPWCRARHPALGPRTSATSQVPGWSG